MSSIIPVKIEYNLQVQNHFLKGAAEHLDNGRQITFYFDDKIVSQKELPDGDFLTDDDCIRELVEKYTKTHTNVFSDLFGNHSDKVHLISKTLDFLIENYGIKMRAHVTVEKDRYIVKVSGNNGDDVFSGEFKSENFSEVLEKVRIFTGTLTEISNKFSENIDELSNDKVEEWIKWN